MSSWNCTESAGLLADCFVWLYQRPPSPFDFALQVMMMMMMMMMIDVLVDAAADINECAMHNGNCSQLCSNNIGSFACSCHTGFRMAPDKRTCVGEFLHCILFITQYLLHFYSYFGRISQSINLKVSYQWPVVCKKMQQNAEDEKTKTSAKNSRPRKSFQSFTE